MRGDTAPDEQVEDLVVAKDRRGRLGWRRAYTALSSRSEVLHVTRSGDQGGLAGLRARVPATCLACRGQPAEQQRGPGHAQTLDQLGQRDDRDPAERDIDGHPTQLGACRQPRLRAIPSAAPLHTTTSTLTANGPSRISRPTGV